MGLEFNREEADKLKEEYGNNDYWVQYLFNKFHTYNWHLPSELVAMAELLYEKTGVKVVKPGSSGISSTRIHPNGRVEREVIGARPEEHFNWSKYED